MSTFAYFLMAAVTILGVCLLLSTRRERRGFDRDVAATGHGTMRISLPVKRPGGTRGSFDKNALRSRLTGCGKYVVRSIN